MITIDEAIKRLEQLVIDLKYWDAPTKDSALKLGIAALKREKANRDNPDFVAVGLLPGETEE